MTGLLNSKSSKLKKHFILATIYLVVYLATCGILFIPSYVYEAILFSSKSVFLGEWVLSCPKLRKLPRKNAVCTSIVAFAPYQNTQGFVSGESSETSANACYDAGAPRFVRGVARFGSLREVSQKVIFGEKIKTTNG